MHRWIAIEAGGMRQRLKPGGAKIRSLAKKLVLVIALAGNDISGSSPQSPVDHARRFSENNLANRERGAPRDELAAEAHADTWRRCRGHCGPPDLPSRTRSGRTAGPEVMREIHEPRRGPGGGGPRLANAIGFLDLVLYRPEIDVLSLS